MRKQNNTYGRNPGETITAKHRTEASSPSIPSSKNDESATLTSRFTKFCQTLSSRKWLTALTVFILITLVEGASFIHTYGPLTMPDPNLHAPSAYALATGQSFNQTKNFHNEEFPGRRQILHGDSRILTLPGAFNKTVEGLDITSLQKDPNKIQQYEGLNNGAHTQKTADFRSNQYLFALYVPQAIGMRIGLSAHLRPSTVLALGRVFNLLTYILLFGAAIIIIPRGKGLMAAIGVLPASVFCGSSLMGDSIVLAFTAFFIALSFRMYESKNQLSRIKILLLILAAILLCFLKYVYAPLVLLPLLTQFALTRKQKILYITSTGVLAGFIIVWWQKYYAYTPKPDIYAQNKMLLINRPLQTLFRLLANDIVVAFAHVKNDPVLITSLLLLAFTMLITLRSMQPEKIGDKRLLYLTCAFTAVASMTLALLSLFLTWNSITDMRETLALSGWQIRYAYPLFPLLLSVYAIKPKRISFLAYPEKATTTL